MNKGSKTPFQPGLSPQGKAKAQIAHQEGKIDRGLAQIKKGEHFIGGMNVESGKMGVAKGKEALAAAKLAKPTGPTIGARTGKGSAPTQLGSAKMTMQTAKLGPQELGAAKLKPQSTSLGAKELGSAKITPFKTANPSNPMGRMGGKPGVNIGTSKFGGKK
jgi:hypothetical protein